MLRCVFAGPGGAFCSSELQAGTARDGRAAALLQLGDVAAGLRPGRVLDRTEEDERDDHEDHEDRRGADRPPDLELRVAADLGRRLAAAAPAELDERVDQDALDQQEDQDAQDERDQVERPDVARVRRPASALRGDRARKRVRGGDQGSGDRADRDSCHARAAGVKRPSEHPTRTSGGLGCASAGVLGPRQRSALPGILRPWQPRPGLRQPHTVGVRMVSNGGRSQGARIVSALRRRTAARRHPL
jgi:hypothetical protein